MKIKTNNHWRDVISGYELTQAEREEWNCFDDERIQEISFVRYKGRAECVSEFLAIPDKEGWALGMPEEWFGWHGYQSDSFFSGLLIRYSDDCEQVQIATYIS